MTRHPDCADECAVAAARGHTMACAGVCAVQDAEQHRQFSPAQQAIIDEHEARFDENGEELCVDCNSWPCKAGCPSRIPEQVTLASLPDVWPFPVKP